MYQFYRVPSLCKRIEKYYPMYFCNVDWIVTIHDLEKGQSYSGFNSPFEKWFSFLLLAMFFTFEKKETHYREKLSYRC